MLKKIKNKNWIQKKKKQLLTSPSVLTTLKDIHKDYRFISPNILLAVIFILFSQN